MDRFEIVTMAPLLFFMLAIGVYPAPILNIINATTTAILGRL
jgi:NADH:ubiquinone oxidoreductase subunit 4 (subunit M)